MSNVTCSQPVARLLEVKLINKEQFSSLNNVGHSSQHNLPQLSQLAAYTGSDTTTTFLLLWCSLRFDPTVCLKVILICIL